MTKRIALLLLIASLLPATLLAGESTRSIQVGDTSVEVLVLEPEGFDPEVAHPLLVALPPGGQSMKLVRSAAESYWYALSSMRGWIVVSPAAPAGRLFVDDEGAALLPGLVKKLEELYKVEGKVHLAGVSNGGKSAFRSAIDNPQLYASLTVMPGVPPSSAFFKRLAELEGLPVLMYVGEQDAPWLKGSRTTAARLGEAGVAVELIVVPGDRHYLRSFSISGLYDRLESHRPAPSD